MNDGLIEFCEVGMFKPWTQYVWSKTGIFLLFISRHAQPSFFRLLLLAIISPSSYSWNEWNVRHFFIKGTGNKSYISCHGPAINHTYRVVTKSLHTTLQNGSHFARGNSCVLRLAFILRWRPEGFFFPQLIQHRRFLTYSIWLTTPITEWWLFLTKDKFKAVSPSALCN